MNLSKKSSLIIALFICVALVGFGVYKYTMKPPASIESKKVDYTGNSSEFIDLVSKSNSNWHGKVIVLKGVISAVDQNKGMTIDHIVYCQFKKPQNISIKKTVKIKGRIIGFDNLLNEIKLDECIILD